MIKRLKSVTFWNDADKNFINFQDQFTHPEHVFQYLRNLWSNNMPAVLEETRGKSIRPQSFESTHMRDRVRNVAIQPVSISMRQIRKVGRCTCFAGVQMDIELPGRSFQFLLIFVPTINIQFQFSNFISSSANDYPSMKKFSSPFPLLQPIHSRCFTPKNFFLFQNSIKFPS